MNEDMTVKSPAVKSPAQSKLVSVDLVSLVAALIFGTAGALVLAGESLADIDLVVLVGIVLIAIGAARFVAVPLRASARRRTLKHDPGKDQDQQQDQVTDL